MSLTLRNDPNAIPSAHTQLKQVNKIKKFIDLIKESINFEIGLCSQDQQNLNSGLQGILEYENEQKGQIDYHFGHIVKQLEREREKMKEQLSLKIQIMKDR